MLVTTCGHCRARFRVTPEQLNLRQGQVRCGQCHETFNGFQSLERFPGDDTGARLLAARAGTTAPAQAGAGAREFPPLPGEDERAPASHKPMPPGVDLPDIQDLPDVPDLLLESPEPAPLEPRADLDPTEPEPHLAAGPARLSRAWSFGVAFLVLVLGLQVTYAFRAALSQQYPALRPVLESACASLGCTVPWVNEESALKLEDSELLEVPGKPGQIALQARIRNLSTSAQEFPHLELTLTDVTGQTAVRRVLRPADYLGHVPATGEVMPAGSEALLSVRLETERIRPTGYELLLFYP